jgi:oxygen-independent coproporphyrinogen III oxidase
MQKDYLEGAPIHTLYLGGGTPSLLSPDTIKELLDAIFTLHDVREDAEITLEANPDDLTPEYLMAIRQVGINRLSIGIQSFQDEVLTFLHRAHNAALATQSVQIARKAGFSSISIDLMYGIPNTSHEDWMTNLQEAIDMRPEHISAYCLTIEEKTAFGHWHKKGTLLPVDEEFAARQFELLVDTLEKAGYEQYEVSNFCLPGHYSRHNSSYWQQEKYLGVGPAAHSFNGVSRQFNKAHNMHYVRDISAGIVPCELDPLTPEDRVNEYLLTGLRTRWGCRLGYLRDTLGYDLMQDQGPYIEKLIHHGKAQVLNDRLVLTKSGKLLADKIASDMFLIPPDKSAS